MLSDDKKRKDFIYLAIASAVLFASIITIHNPATVYIGNVEIFSLELRHFLLVSGIPFVSIAIVLVAPALVVRGKILHVYAFALSYLAILVWIYSNFIVLDFGLMDGRDWDFAIVDKFRWVEIPAIILSWFLLPFMVINKPRIFLYFFVFLNFALLVPTAYAIVSDPKEATLEERPDLQAAFRFSKQQNTLIVLMDSFQSDLLADVLQRRPKLADELSGFAYFPDTLGLATTTYLTLPSIHSGAIYSSRIPVRVSYESGIREGSFLNDLAAAGHDVSLVNPLQDVCPAQIALCVGGDELLHGKTQVLVNEAAYLLDLSVFRAVPLIYKETIYNGQYWSVSPAMQLLSILVGRREHQVLEANRILEALTARGAKTVDRPVTKFLHLMNTHLPYVLDSNCRVHRQEIESKRLAATLQYACAMDAFVGLLDYLKREGLYDGAMIVLISDTGAGIHSGYVPHDEPDPVWPGLVGWANPLFLVKVPGAQGPLRQMTGSVQPSDIPATVCGIIRDCVAQGGISVFDAGSVPARTRTYKHYSWQHKFFGKDVILNIHTYTVQGAIWKRESWTNYPLSH